MSFIVLNNIICKNNYPAQINSGTKVWLPHIKIELIIFQDKTKIPHQIYSKLFPTNLFSLNFSRP